MLQEVSRMPLSNRRRKSERWAPGKHVLLMDQTHPVHLTMTAEVKGITKVQSWSDALDAVQKRHPILSAMLPPSVISSASALPSAAAKTTAQ